MRGQTTPLLQGQSPACHARKREKSGTYAGQLRRSNLSFAGRTGHTPLGVSRLSRSGKNQVFECPDRGVNLNPARANHRANRAQIRSLRRGLHYSRYQRLHCCFSQLSWHAGWFSNPSAWCRFPLDASLGLNRLAYWERKYLAAHRLCSPTFCSSSADFHSGFCCLRGRCASLCLPDISKGMP